MARDQALFKALFFAGDRAADLLQLKTGDIMRFPDNSGFLLNHIWTKTLRSGDENVFALKRDSNEMVCPVGVCLLVEGRGSRVEGRGSRVTSRGSRVTSRGSRVNGRGSRVNGRGSKIYSKLFSNYFLTSSTQKFTGSCLLEFPVPVSAAFGSYFCLSRTFTFPRTLRRAEHQILG